LPDEQVKAIAVRSGFHSTVQDLGRTGFRRFGISLGGALDPFAARLANLMVGNDDTAAVLETAFGAVSLGFGDDRIVAWSGGDFVVRIGSTVLPPGHASHVAAGDVVEFGVPQHGCRAWLAISGGIDVPLVLGSRATDVRTGFGGLDGRRIQDGDEIPLLPNPDRAVMLLRRLAKQEVGHWSPPRQWTNANPAKAILRFVPGTEWSRLSSGDSDIFKTQSFSVSTDSDRMGIRLNGPSLRSGEGHQLLSEAIAPGTVQIPPSGQPILLLRDCQTIGGYPKIAHVLTVDLGIAAQLRPNNEVSFRQETLAEAHRLLLQQQAELRQFRCGLNAYF
jgi:antagonist of KipI